MILAFLLTGPGTQNQNEAFNALIWQRATKETHSSLPTVELVTFLAVGIFNDGAKAIVHILENLGIKPGFQTKKCLEKIDFDRLRHSVRKSSEKQKNKRKKIRQTKKGYIDGLSEKKAPNMKLGHFEP